MNILALPDEMLASVHKYCPSKTLLQARKLSSRLNSVARNFKLDKFKMTTMWIRNKPKYIEVYFYSNNPLSQWKFKHPSGTLLQQMKHYLSKIHLRYLAKLGFVNSDKKHLLNISNKMIELLLTEDIRNMSDLTMDYCKISVNSKLMKGILSKAKPCRLYLKGHFEEDVLTDDLIDGIQFGALELIGSKHQSKITLSCLVRLCERKLPILLSCQIYNSTVTELGEFFEKYLRDGMNKAHFWQLAIGRGHMANNAIIAYLSNLECFENCTVVMDKPDLHPRYSIFRIKNKSNWTVDSYGVCESFDLTVFMSAF